MTKSYKAVIEADSAGRDAIKQDLDTCMLVEAGPGSGKTTELINRMVGIIAAGKTEIGEIAAITFTRKAASEIQGRFRAALEEAAVKEADKERAGRLGNALGQFDRAFIGTIHSFCSRLLRERPVEAGVDPDFTELDEEEAALLRKEHFRRFIQQDGASLAAEVRDLGIEPVDLEDTFSVVCAYPDVKIITGKIRKPDLRPMRDELSAFIGFCIGAIDKCMKRFGGGPSEFGWDRLQRRVFASRRLLDAGAFEADARLVGHLEDFYTAEDPGIKITCWKGDRKRNEAVEAVVEQVKEQYRRFRLSCLDCLDEWRRFCHAPVFELLAAARDFHVSGRRREGRYTFEDQLLLCRDLLRRRPDVREFFRLRVKVLLVDEFQDTDPVQAEIMFYLAGRPQDAAGTDWTGFAPEPGRLFVVGDPKQAIYRFRRADLSTYERVKALMEKCHPVARLTLNHRSTAGICRRVEETFRETDVAAAIPFEKIAEKCRLPGDCVSLGGKLLPEGGSEYQAAFAPLVPASDRAEDDSGVLLMTVPRGPGVDAAHAEAVAELISRAISSGISFVREKSDKNRQRPARPSDFMVLTWRNSAPAVYAKALEKAGVPYEVASAGSLGDGDPVRAFVLALCCIADPGDNILLAASLRGLLFGLSDRDLYEFRKAGGEIDFFAAERLSDGPRLTEGVRRVEAALEAFRRWREVSGRESLTSLCRAIAADTGLLPCALTGELGRMQAGRMVKILEIVRRKAAAGMSLGELGRYLRELVFETAAASEEMPLRQEQEGGCVRVMNIHKAKGLEAPVVILAEPSMDFAKNNAWFIPQLHITRAAGEATGYFTAWKKRGEFGGRQIVAIPPGWLPGSGGGAPARGWMAEEMRFLAAEFVRLLYVAATRARDLLVIPAQEEGRGFWSPLVVQGLRDTGDPWKDAARPPIPASEPPAPHPSFTFPSLTSLAAPTYRLSAVTALAKKTADFERAPAASRGREWGSIIHGLLEACGLDPSLANEPGRRRLSALAEKTLSAEGFPAEDRGKALDACEAFLSSDLWRRALSSPERHVEVPVSSLIEKECLPVVARGVIDLIFLERNGWVLVDYKTDRVEGGEDLPRLTELYTHQLALYRRFWEKATGEKVNEAHLFFLSASRAVPV